MNKKTTRTGGGQTVFYFFSLVIFPTPVLAGSGSMGIFSACEGTPI